MHFPTLFTPIVALFATAVLTSPIEKRAVTADQVVQTLGTITQQSKSLTTIANKINAMDGVPLLGPGAGSGVTSFNDVITGLQGIITTGTTASQAMDGTAPYTDTAAEQKVCDAYANFVVVHQNLLKVLIGKSGLLIGIFQGPVAASLRQLESVVDTLSFYIIDSVPVCADKATANKNDLDETLGKAVCAYTPAGSLGLNLFC